MIQKQFSYEAVSVKEYWQKTLGSLIEFTRTKKTLDKNFISGNAKWKSEHFKISAADIKSNVKQ